MAFTLDELPVKQFELIGLSKRDVINLPPSTLNALLGGSRTSLIRFTNLQVVGFSQGVSLDAKLSLDRSPTGEVLLKMHPINQKANNIYSLSDKEIAQLEKKESNFVEKKIQGADGKVMDALVSYDKVTKEFVAVNKASLNAPDSINNVPLTPQQKTDFKSGKDVEIGKDKFRLDPNSEIGLSNSESGDRRGIERVKFKNRSYSANELILDLALIASGLGFFVMLEHLAGLVIHSRRTQQQNIQDPKYWEAINDAAKEIKMLKEELRYERGRVGEIVSKHLEQFGIVHSVEKTDLHDITAKKGKEFSGKLLEHGVAPYEFKQGEKDSYFVKYLDKGKKELIVWGVDLERAVKESGVQVGQQMNLKFLGKNPVTVDAPIKENGKIVGYEKIDTHRNQWQMTPAKVRRPTM